MIPSKFVISKLNENVLSYCKNKGINLDSDYDCLIAFLNMEKKKENSFFQDYFKTLPTDFSSFPINYNSEERYFLKNSLFLKRLIKFEKEVEQVFKSITDSGVEINLEDFLQIYLLIQSRSFGLDTPEKTIDALVPFADMFNTSLNPKPCFWYFDDDNNFNAQAVKNILRGEEINITYNEGHNTDFLLYYGFTIQDNPYGHIYDFEINLEKNLVNKEEIENFDSNSNEIFKIELDIKPSLKYFNLNKFRNKINISQYFLNNLEISLNDNFNKDESNVRNIYALHSEDLKIFKIIKNEIFNNLKNYSCPYENINNNNENNYEENFNLINIKRVLIEEKRVLEINLEYIRKIIEAIEKENFENLDISNYYDIEYFNKLKIHQNKKR
jgi:hypothetical protein